MEIVTELPLSAAQVASELPQIVQWLREKQVIDLDLMYGVGCNAETDRLWTAMPVELGALEDFIRRSVQDGIFAFANSDLYISSRGKHTDDNDVVSFKLCHEADIHLVTDDRALLEKVKAHWLTRRWTVYQGPGGLSRDWSKFTSEAGSR